MVSPFYSLQKLAFAAIFTATVISSAAQSPFWNATKGSTHPVLQEDRVIVPDRFLTYHLDFNAIKLLLSTAPSEADVVSGGEGLLLTLPLPNGRMEQFQVWEAPVMAPELTAQYPDIRSYAGKSASNNGMLVRFDVTPMGFHAMMMNTGQGNYFIDPYARGNTDDYQCYFKRDFVKRVGGQITCNVEGDQFSTEIPTVEDRGVQYGSCGNLRTYRLALACTGEYANYFGVTPSNPDTAVVLAAMNTTMTRVNGIFEHEASIRMIIVANNKKVVYTNTATDPFTNSDLSLLLPQNQSTCDAQIGSASYDIGHIFCTTGGGLATVRSPCNNTYKAKAVTGLEAPIGDPFDVDFVSHEIGHQWGGLHMQFNACNRTDSTAMEPGSASTIMGYAGVCSPNVQNNSDDYFHTHSLQMFATFTAGTGGTCATLVSNGNTAPVAGNVTDRTIPYSTPFILSGSATDANGDALTYTWEQVDPYTGAQTMPPVSTNSSGPMFRSYPPNSTGIRYLPNLPDVLANYDYEWEELPSIARTMKFRMTVRDNRANGGCTTQKQMTVTTTTSAGPFMVTNPNTGLTWGLGTTQTVTWNVAGTTSAPVSCPNVDILVSTDGGVNFSNLVTSTPNDGTQTVTAPNVTTTSARIMVKCSNNIFYDVSNEDFAIGLFCNQTYMSTNVPKTIPTSGSVSSTLTISPSATISDVNVVGLNGTHSWISDITVTLKSPNNTQRTLFSGICGSDQDFNLGFDDESANSVIACPPTTGLLYQPTQALSAYDNLNVNGIWTLTITDAIAPDGGILNAWGLSFCSTTAFPVELLQFSGRAQENEILLNWATASEKNNKGFHVERSVGNAFHFKNIGWVEGHGNATERNEYPFVDRDVKPGEVYYYRLEQEDEDGMLHNSEVVAVVTDGDKYPLLIYPNPAHSSVRITLPAAAEEQLFSVQICAANGQIIRTLSPEKGQEIDVHDIPSGVYLMRALAENQVYQSVLVIQ